MKKNLLLFIGVTVLAVGCKNKNTAKMLEGTWNEVNVDGVDIPVSAQDKLVFGQCKGGKNAECTLTIIDASGATFNDFDYTVVEGGKYLRTIQKVGFITSNINHEIKDLTDNTMTIEWTLPGDNYTGMYEKQ